MIVDEFMLAGVWWHPIAKEWEEGRVEEMEGEEREERGEKGKKRWKIEEKEERRGGLKKGKNR